MQSLLCDIKPAELARTQGKHCSLIKNLCQNTGKADLATCGLSLVEVLVGAAIGAVVMLGTAKTLAVALQSSNIVRTIVTEQELKGALTKAMSGEQTETKDSSNNLIGVTRKNCAKNLAPNNLIAGTANYDTTKGEGEISTLFKVNDEADPPDPDDRPAGDPQDEKLIEIGSFRGNIEVVKMELIDPSKDGGTPSDPTTEVVSRRLIVRYKKTSLGQLNTVGNKECSSSDQSGCYFHVCNVDYKLASGADSTAGADQVEVCQSYDCFQYGAMTASQKYCVHEDCFNGGCLRWSNKKPKDEEKQYSFVEPFVPVNNLNALRNSQFTIDFEKKGEHLTIRTARSDPIVATKAKKGCCTIKKYYINKALGMLKSIENGNRDTHQPIGLFCGAFLYGNNSLAKAIDNMLHPSIDAKCPSDIPKDFATFLNLPTITHKGRQEGSIYPIDRVAVDQYLTSDKKCVKGSSISYFESGQRNAMREPNRYHYEPRATKSEDGEPADATYYYIHYPINMSFHGRSITRRTAAIYFPYWKESDWPDDLTLP